MLNEPASPELIGKLSARFEQLVELSTAQMDALDNDRFDELAELLNEKDRLLAEIDELRQQDARGAGILHVASRGGESQGSSLRDKIERFRAHEKYVTRQMSQRLTNLGDRLQALRKRRTAAQGYSSGAPGHSFFDLSR